MCNLPCGSWISQRSDAPVTRANDHRHRTAARFAALAVMFSVALCALMALATPSFARDRLQREELEAWWNETQAGKSATRKTCAVAAETGCSRDKVARSRGAAYPIVKRARNVTANARAEARQSADSDAARTPRHDRPGRYFLHGPRF
ncbi:hypothetical protein [Bradyrhizobium oligotrophicum]|nr:hypothetical protein [Bradyrhizobium oligotrophicum]